MEHIGEYKGYTCYKLKEGEGIFHTESNLYLKRKSTGVGYNIWLYGDKVGETDNAFNVEWFNAPEKGKRTTPEYRKKAPAPPPYVAEVKVEIVEEKEEPVSVTVPVTSTSGEEMIEAVLRGQTEIDKMIQETLALG